MSKILIKNGKVWDGNKFFFADLLTENKRVVKIAENINEEAEFVYDATGKIVSAGLVDAHIHIRGISCEAFGIAPEIACLPFGVTAAADASAGEGSAEYLENIAVRNKVFVCPEVKDNTADFREVERLIGLYGERVVGLKTFFDERAFEVKDVTSIKQICDYAHKRGLIVMVHSIGSPVPMKELFEALSAGDIVTHAYHGTKNNCSVDDFASLKEAKKRGIIIDVGTAGHVNTDFAVYKKGIEADAKPDIISTDITRASAYKRGGRYGMTMCMNIAAALGMSEEKIFKAVTTTPAAALKMSGCGELKEGGFADIAVFAYTDEPFELTDFSQNTIKSQKGYRCELTVFDSEVVFRY